MKHSVLISSSLIFLFISIIPILTTVFPPPTNKIDRIKYSAKIAIPSAIIMAGLAIYIVKNIKVKDCDW